MTRRFSKRHAFIAISADERDSWEHGTPDVSGYEMVRAAVHAEDLAGIERAADLVPMAENIRKYLKEIGR